MAVIRPTVTYANETMITKDAIKSNNFNIGEKYIKKKYFFKEFKWKIKKTVN